MITLTEIIARAKDSYSGWAGWHHSWHWPRNGNPIDTARQIRDEARNESDRMQETIGALKARRQKTLELVDICDNYIADEIAFRNGEL